MTDAATFWPLACTALAEGDYAQGFVLLQAGAMISGPEEQAQYVLLAGSLHALYGAAALPELQMSLQEALRLSPALAADPLYLALHAEAETRAGRPTLPPPAAREAADPLARFHALSACVLAGHLHEAAATTLTADELPPHLGWRAAALQAEAFESLGDPEQAAALFAQAAAGATGPDRAVMLQEGAALLLAQGQPEEAQKALAEARTLHPAAAQDAQDSLNLSTWHYLAAQVALALGRPEEALIEIEHAAALETQYGDRSYGVALVRGQVLNTLGRSPEAVECFREAAQLADPADRSYALHELAVAYLDQDQPLEAREVLQDITRDPAYPFQAEIEADLAECDYRLGQLGEAQSGAEQALRQGAVVPASLVLGNVALEYYRLDEALAHFERVIQASPEGSREWLIGQQMAADILAQQGFQQPAQVYAYAQAALQYTPENDEWYPTLQDHLSRASALIQGGAERVLN